MEKEKEQQFKDFESGKINLGGNELLEYMSKMYLRAGEPSEIVLKLVEEQGKMYLAKQLIISKNTKKDTPISDTIIKGLKKLIEVNIEYLGTVTIHNHSTLIKMLETIQYCDLLSISDIHIEIDYLRVQYAKYNFDYDTANEIADVLHNKYSKIPSINSIVKMVKAEIYELQNFTPIFPEEIENKINNNLGLTESENEFLINMGFEKIDEPLEFCKFANYYKRHNLDKIYLNLLQGLFNYAFQEGMQNNDINNMLIDLNILAFLNPTALTFGCRAFGKWKNDDPVGAKRDMDKAFIIDKNFIDPIAIEGGQKTLIKDIIKEEIDTFYSFDK